MYFDGVYNNIGLLAMLDPFLDFYQRWYLCFYKAFIIVTGTALFSLAGLVKYSGLFIVFLVMLIISSLSRINYFGFEHRPRVAVVNAFRLTHIDEISSETRTLDTCTPEIPGKPSVVFPKVIRKYSAIQIRKSNHTP